MSSGGSPVAQFCCPTTCPAFLPKNGRRDTNASTGPPSIQPSASSSTLPTRGKMHSARNRTAAAAWGTGTSYYGNRRRTRTTSRARAYTPDAASTTRTSIPCCVANTSCQNLFCTCATAAASTALLAHVVLFERRDQQSYFRTVEEEEQLLKEELQQSRHAGCNYYHINMKSARQEERPMILAAHARIVREEGKGEKEIEVGEDHALVGEEEGMGSRNTGRNDDNNISEEQEPGRADGHSGVLPLASNSSSTSATAIVIPGDGETVSATPAAEDFVGDDKPPPESMTSNQNPPTSTSPPTANKTNMMRKEQGQSSQDENQINGHQRPPHDQKDLAGDGEHEHLLQRDESDVVETKQKRQEDEEAGGKVADSKSKTTTLLEESATAAIDEHQPGRAPSVKSADETTSNAGASGPTAMSEEVVSGPLPPGREDANAVEEEDGAEDDIAPREDDSSSREDEQTSDISTTDYIKSTVRYYLQDLALSVYHNKHLRPFLAKTNIVPFVVRTFAAPSYFGSTASSRTRKNSPATTSYRQKGKERGTNGEETREFNKKTKASASTGAQNRARSQHHGRHEVRVSSFAYDEVDAQAAKSGRSTSTRNLNTAAARMENKFVVVGPPIRVDRTVSARKNETELLLRAAAAGAGKMKTSSSGRLRRHDESPGGAQTSRVSFNSAGTSAHDSHDVLKGSSISFLSGEEETEMLEHDHERHHAAAMKTSSAVSISTSSTSEQTETILRSSYSYHYPALDFFEADNTCFERLQHEVLKLRQPTIFTDAGAYYCREKDEDNNGNDLDTAWWGTFKQGMNRADRNKMYEDIAYGFLFYPTYDKSGGSSYCGLSTTAVDDEDSNDPCVKACGNNEEFENYEKFWNPPSSVDLNEHLSLCCNWAWADDDPTRPIRCKPDTLFNIMRRKYTRDGFATAYNVEDSHYCLPKETYETFDNDNPDDRRKLNHIPACAARVFDRSKCSGGIMTADCENSCNADPESRCEWKKPPTTTTPCVPLPSSVSADGASLGGVPPAEIAERIDLSQSTKTWVEFLKERSMMPSMTEADAVSMDDKVVCNEAANWTGAAPKFYCPSPGGDVQMTGCNETLALLKSSSNLSNVSLENVSARLETEKASARRRQMAGGTTTLVVTILIAGGSSLLSILLL
ncbi:unnamed protein product [Amoebophrya sp. A120]|nr:unnamed protein product [Amoebophrya sp. A120]|eukprot:GSA120T00008503001.1